MGKVSQELETALAERPAANSSEQPDKLTRPLSTPACHARGHTNTSSSPVRRTCVKPSRQPPRCPLHRPLRSALYSFEHCAVQGDDPVRILVDPVTERPFLDDAGRKNRCDDFSVLFRVGHRELRAVV